MILLDRLFILLLFSFSSVNFDISCLASGVMYVRSQARRRVAKVHRLRNEEAKQFAIQISQVNERTIQRHKKDGAATRQLY
jgi:hypothetical protein